MLAVVAMIGHCYCQLIGCHSIGRGQDHLWAFRANHRQKQISWRKLCWTVSLDNNNNNNNNMTIYKMPYNVVRVATWACNNVLTCFSCRHQLFSLTVSEIGYQCVLKWLINRPTMGVIEDTVAHWSFNDLHVLVSARQVKPMATICREVADDSCDLGEYCDGVSAFCPSDAYVADGTQCHTDEVWCACVIILFVSAALFYSCDSCDCQVNNNNTKFIWRHNAIRRLQNK